MRIEKDDLGELLCPRCGTRVCPKAHIIEGRICPSCGWEDPNYYLWQKAQKVRTQASQAAESEQPPNKKSCPICHTMNDASAKYCRNRSCNWDFRSRLQTTQQPPVITAELPIKLSPDTTRYRPAQPHIAAPSSPMLQEKEIRKAGHRGWDPASIKRFLQPIGASLLVVGVILGIAFLLTKTILPSFSPPTGTASPEISVPRVSSPAEAYTLSTSVVPPEGGQIQISTSPSSETDSQITETFPPGTEIVLTPQPSDCYTFDRWEIGDTVDRKETITITMDSDKSIALFFKQADAIPPSILEVEVCRLSDISATITLTTDELSSVTVRYGETTEALDRTTEPEEEPTSSDNTQFKYSIPLTGLKSNTTYYYRVEAQDTCGNVATSDIETLTTARSIPEGYRVGKRAPDFKLQYYHDDNPDSPNKRDRTFSLSQLRGKKVLLNFWNTFCAACLREFPHIRAIYEDERWADKNSNPKYALITVCIDGRADRIVLLEEKYRDRIGLFTFPILLDTDKEIIDKYHILYVPTTFLIDSDGIIRKIKIGPFKSVEEIEKAFDSLE